MMHRIIPTDLNEPIAKPTHHSFLLNEASLEAFLDTSLVPYTALGFEANALDSKVLFLYHQKIQEISGPYFLTSTQILPIFPKVPLYRNPFEFGKVDKGFHLEPDEVRTFFETINYPKEIWKVWIVRKQDELLFMFHSPAGTSYHFWMNLVDLQNSSRGDRESHNYSTLESMQFCEQLPHSLKATLSNPEKLLEIHIYLDLGSQTFPLEWFLQKGYPENHCSVIRHFTNLQIAESMNPPFNLSNLWNQKKPLRFLIIADPDQSLPLSYQEGETLFRMAQQSNPDGCVHVEFYSLLFDAHSVFSLMSQCDVLHFTGHGHFDPIKGNGWRLSDTLCIYAEDIRSLSQVPQLITSSACYEGDPSNPYKESIYKALLEKGCQAILAPTQRIEEHNYAKWIALFYSLIHRGWQLEDSHYLMSRLYAVDEAERMNFSIFHP